MSWETAGDNRWRWTADNDQHLLALVDGELRELHGETVHIYTPTSNDVDTDAPLDAAKHGRTVVSKAMVPADEGQAFTWLEQGRYDRR